MTSSQDPPLTRREMRERERLLEQQEPSATPDTAHGAAPAPVAAPVQLPPLPPTPAQAVPAPSLPVSASSPAFAAPRPAAGYADAAPFGAASPAAPAVPGAAPVPQQSPFAPRQVPPPPSALQALQPVQPAPVSAAQASQQTGQVDSSTPERTLTRRELRAMLDGTQLDEFDLEDDAAEQPVDSSQARAVAPAPATRPSETDADASASATVGHWTSQLNAPVEAAEPFDQLLSRGGVSHGVPTTTNALILPNLPDHGSIGSPLSAIGNPLAAPGEIIATGSIDLPRSYGATGVHPSRIDSSDVDRLFDQVEDVGTGAAPVAATSAISTQGAARAMIAPPKKEGMNVPLVLAVTAGVLALGVVGTLVIGAIAGLF